MNIVILIATASILVAVYYFRNFFIHRRKVTELAQSGIETQGLLLEVRNLGLQNNSNSRMSEIAVKFDTTQGKPHIVRHKKELLEGEVIPVGSSIGLIYLESDPGVCNIPSLGMAAENKWTSLVVGIFVLVAGLFTAYVVFINIGTV